MDALCQRSGEGLVDGAVSFHQGLGGKGLANNDYLEVGLGVRRNAVHVALVEHLKALGCESAAQCRFDRSLDGSRGGHASTVPRR